MNPVRLITTIVILALGSSLIHAQTPATLIPINDPHLRMLGRYDDRTPDHPRVAYPGAGLEFRFRGTSAQLQLTADTPMSALTIVVDHGAPALQLLTRGDNTVNIPMPMDEGPHTVQIYKRTETWQGILTFDDITLLPGGTLLDLPPLPVRKLMFMGDSVTCGVGIDNNAQCTHDPQLPDINPYGSYGMLLGRRLDAASQLVCYGGRGIERDYRGLGIADNVVNAPQFLSLAIPSDKPEGRVSWDFARFQPDAIVLSLGTNDFNLEKTRPLDENKWVDEYVAFLHQVRTAYPRALIFVTEGAIVTNPLLRQMIQRAAAESLDSRVLYTPSQHYPGNGCNGHPTRIQHQHMADDFEPVLRRALHW
ncbi:MAG TPA: SGNH/GDSL hydrolase family protein [Terracidiphilus sp.]|jgi:lysophospholipase L1-like esterase|nr:SGNH/GDSL hydrolase family protein [Terracidiphilus sp.]